MYVSPIPTVAADRPLTPLGRYDRPLLAYVHNRLETLDWGRGEKLARLAWARALGTLQRSGENAGMEEDIPSWLAAAARSVIREQTSPAFAVDIDRSDLLIGTPGSGKTKTAAVRAVAARLAG